MKKTTIDIYGRKYHVTSEYEDRYIDRLTQYVNSKIKELVIKNNRLDYADACALCLLNVADDIATSQDKLNSEIAKNAELIKELEELSNNNAQLNAKLEKLVSEKEKLEETAVKRDEEIVKLKLSLEDSYKKAAPKTTRARTASENPEKKGE